MLYNKQAITKMWAIVLAVVILVAAVAGSAAYYLTLPTPKKEILVGAAISQTGSYGAAGNTLLEGYKLWEKDVNQRGGILGIPVRFIVYDDKSDPATTKSLYERLITVDKVDFLLGPYSSACSFAMAPVAEKYHMVVLHDMNNAKSIFSQGWEYQFMVVLGGLTDLQQQMPFFLMLSSMPADQKPKTIGVVNTADLYPQGVANGTIAFAKQYGFDVVFHEEIEKGSTDVTAVVSKLKNANPDAVFFSGYFPEETLLIRTTYELGFHPKAIQSYLAMLLWTQAVSTLGQQANGVYGNAQYLTSYNFAGNAQFVQMYKAQYNKEPTIYQAMGYSCCLLLEKAIIGVGKSNDQEAVRTWLLNNKVELPIGTWQVDQTLANQGIKYVPQVSLLVHQIIDGVPQIVYPPANATHTFVYPLP